MLNWCLDIQCSDLKSYRHIWYNISISYPVADSPEVSLDQQYSEQAVAGQQATNSKAREVTIKIDCVVHSNPQPQVGYLDIVWYGMVWFGIVWYGMVTIKIDCVVHSNPQPQVIISRWWSHFLCFRTILSKFLAKLGISLKFFLTVTEGLMKGLGSWCCRVKMCA